MTWETKPGADAHAAQGEVAEFDGDLIRLIGRTVNGIVILHDGPSGIWSGIGTIVQAGAGTMMGAAITGLIAVKGLGPFLEAFARTLGGQLAQSSADSLRRLLVSGRRGQDVTLKLEAKPV